MRVAYAWHNVFHNRRRAAAALAGIAFSVLLVFMQVGFLETARRGSTLLYDYLDFSILLTSDKYENLDISGELDLNHLVQAAVTPGVERVEPFLVGRAHWEDLETKLESTLMLLGCDPQGRVFAEPSVASRLAAVAPPKTVMQDLLSHRALGPALAGREVKINGHYVTVTSLFSLGMGFYREGAALVSADTFHRLMEGDRRRASLGLVQLAPGAEASRVKRDLRAALPPEVIVWERRELLDKERDYFLSVKPVGIMFQAGALVSLVVGGLILFQVLSTEIATKLHEFATLKALGYGDRRVYLVGVQQALIYAGLSYLISLAAAWGIFALAHALSRLPIFMTWDLALTVLALALAACSLSGVLALRRVRRADPAELF